MSQPTAKIIFFGHSTVLIETEDGKRLMIDPFLEGNPLCPEDLQDPGPLDAICLSHGHADHASSAVSLAKKYNCPVFATYELANLLAKEGVPAENLQFMNNGGRVELPNANGVAVNLTNAFHSNSFDASDGNTYYAGQAAGIVVELESGRAIYHAGDTCLFTDMTLIADRFTPEVALLPIGDRFTMGPEDAAKAAELIQPKIAIPIHFATFDALTGTPKEFEAQLNNSNIAVRTLEPGNSIEF